MRSRRRWSRRAVVRTGEAYGVGCAPTQMRPDVEKARAYVRRFHEDMPSPRGRAASDRRPALGLRAPRKLRAPAPDPRRPACVPPDARWNARDLEWEHGELADDGRHVGVWRWW